MSKIDLTIHKEGLAHNIQKAKENNIIIPTIAQMQNPDLIPETFPDSSRIYTEEDFRIFPSFVRVRYAS